MAEKGWMEIAEQKIAELTSSANVKWSELVEIAQKNYDEMTKQSKAGKEDFVVLLKKAQVTVQDKLKSSKDDTMKKLNDKFKEVAAEKEPAQKKIDEFQQQLTQTWNDMGDKTSKGYKEAMEKIKKYSGKSKGDFEAYYKDMEGKLNSSFDEVIKKFQD